MRIVFGVLGLLIVAAIVGSLAKQQLQALRGLPVGAAASAQVQGASAASGAVADSNAATSPQPPQNLPRSIADEVKRQMEQGAARPIEGTP